MLIKKGQNAINIRTNRWLWVREDIDLKVGDILVLANNKTYRVVGFINSRYVQVID